MMFSFSGVLMKHTNVEKGSEESTKKMTDLCVDIFDVEKVKEKDMFGSLHTVTPAGIYSYQGLHKFKKGLFKEGFRQKLAAVLWPLA